MARSLVTFARARMAQKGYTVRSDFFADLVRQERRRAADERLEEMVLEGLNSGEPVEVTDEWWTERRRELRRRTRKTRRR